MAKVKENLAIKHGKGTLDRDALTEHRLLLNTPFITKTVPLAPTTTIFYQNILSRGELENYESYNVDVSMVNDVGFPIAYFRAIITRRDTSIILIDVAHSDKGKLYLSVGGTGHLQAVISHQYMSYAKVKVTQISF